MSGDLECDTGFPKMAKSCLDMSVLALVIFTIIQDVTYALNKFTIPINQEPQMSLREVERQYSTAFLIYYDIIVLRYYIGVSYVRSTF